MKIIFCLQQAKNCYFSKRGFGLFLLNVFFFFSLQAQFVDLNIEDPSLIKKQRQEAGSILTGDLHLALAREQQNNNLTMTALVEPAALANAKELLEPILFNSTGQIGIHLRVTDINNALSDLNEIGFVETGRHEAYKLLEGFLPVNQLAVLDGLKTNIFSARAIYKAKNNKGATTSQADVVLESDRLRAMAPSYDGRGIKIGVLSDSYDNLNGAAGGIASGDLPTKGVTVLQDLASGGSDEGRAMIELIHDIAPGSDLFFASAFFGQLSFANNIQRLADAGCKVIVDDIVYFAEPFFQDGIIAQSVDNVANNQNVCYFSSAGNGARESYESTTINFAPNPDFGGVLFYDFDPGPGVDFYQQYEVNGTFRPALQWDDPFYTTNGVDTDLDLYIHIGEGGSIIARSLDDNIANQVPFEFTGVRGTGTISISIPLYTGPQPNRIKIINFGSSHNPLEHDMPSSTIGNHAAAKEGVAVAAAPHFNRAPESFTSYGPNTFLFNKDGSRKTTPEIRQTPDITCTDGTNTTFFGENLSDGDNFPNFFGTSAAAPHAAAVAAIIKQVNPNISHKNVLAKMIASAQDIHTAGFDNVTGHGLINAYDIIFPNILPIATGTEDLEKGFLNSAWTTNSNAGGRIIVSPNEGPCQGTEHLLLDTWRIGGGGPGESLNEAILNIDLHKTAKIFLSFDQKEFDDEDHPMSSSFSGSENSDGVAYSFDGVNWTRLVSLTGSESTNDCKSFNFEINVPRNIAQNKSAARSSSNTLQIKFQQYGQRPVVQDGLAFDNIIVNKVATTAIPTMSEWGLIIFALLMLNLGLVFIYSMPKNRMIS
jgi:subtilisin family serine protease